MSLRVERLLFPSQLYNCIAAECHMAFLPDEESLRTTAVFIPRRRTRLSRHETRLRLLIEKNRYTAIFHALGRDLYIVLVNRRGGNGVRRGTAKRFASRAITLILQSNPSESAES
jgi:hypothetical protein